MGLTVNNLGTLSILNILNRTSTAQQNVVYQMATGSRINRGADDPAGLIAVTGLTSELKAIDAGIASNQRTDTILDVADKALGQVASILEDIQRLANESSSAGGLSADELAANQAQIDDALASIDRIIASTQFNGSKLLDGSLSIRAAVGDNTKVSDLKVYSRKAGTSDVSLTVTLSESASNAILSRVALSGGITADTTFSLQGKLGTVVIAIESGETLSSVADKIVKAAGQTGISATVGGSTSGLIVRSRDSGADAFVRVSFISGDSTNLGAGTDNGKDAVVLVNGQNAAVDGNHVAYAGGGVSVAFENLMTAAASTTTITIYGDSSGVKSGATFQLGTTSTTRATIGLDGVYTHQLGDATDGYLATLGSGKGNSLLDDPSQAATIARKAAMQIATLQGRVGGFQKFQVRTALNSLQDTKQGLESARSVMKDVDYAVANAELNRQNVLMQSAISLLGLANQQAAQVLALLR